MTDRASAARAPLVLDSTVLRELARGEIATIELVLRFDAAGQPMVAPALAMTQAVLDAPTEDAVPAMHGLAEMDNVVVTPVRDAAQAVRLAQVMTLTELATWDAHVAAVADASTCPILTFDAARWDQPARSLEPRLHILEISDPDDKRDG